jgi:hypothetical protein
LAFSGYLQNKLGEAVYSNMKKIILTVFLCLSLNKAVGQMYFFYDYSDGNTYNASSSAPLISLSSLKTQHNYNPHSPVVSAAFKLGRFTGGFAPTLMNVSQWMSNFVGVDGAYIAEGAFSIAREWFSSGIDNATLAPNEQQLSMIIYNEPVYDGYDLIGYNFNTATKYAILTNPQWLYRGNLSDSYNQGPFQPPQYTFDFNGATFTDGSGQRISRTTGETTVLLGEYVNRVVTLVGVPEPSSLSLCAVGLGGLAMMRRRRS